MAFPLTLLRASVRTGKKLIFEDGQWTKKDGEHALNFKVSTATAHDVDSLYEVLTKAAKSSTILIYGRPKRDFKDEPTLRRRENFDDCPVHVAIYDLDHFGCTERDPLKAAEIARAQLPPQFHDTRCVVQATSGHTINGNARIRLYFPLTTPVSLAELKVWSAQGAPIYDPVVFRVVQPIYLQDPICIGAPDPVPTRWAILDGLDETATPPADLAAVTAAFQERKKEAPEGVTIDAPHMLDSFLTALKNRPAERILSDKRRVTLMLAAMDAHDRAISDTTAEAILSTWTGADPSAFTDLLEHEPIPGLDPSFDSRLSTLAADTESAWHAEDQDELDYAEIVPRYVSDGYRSAQSTFGSKYTDPITGDEFGIPDTDNPLGMTEEERKTPQHVLDAKEKRQAEKNRRNKPLTVIHWENAVTGALEDEAEPLIDGILYQNNMAVLYGASNSGKTFVALDMAVAVAGLDTWNGRKVYNGGVIYVAAEAGRSIRKRIAALQRKYGRAFDKFSLVIDPVDLRDPTDADLKRLFAVIKAERERMGGVAMVVFDTFSRVMAGGDENSSVDMGRMVMVFDTVRTDARCTVLLVHHTGKDALKGARGHSLLRAATDTEIEISAEQTEENGVKRHVGVIKITKQRDTSATPDLGFTLKGVLLGETPNGVTVTSAYVEYGAPEKAAKDGKPRLTVEGLPTSQRLVYDALVEGLEAAGAEFVDGSVVIPLAGGTAPGAVRTQLGRLADGGLVRRGPKNGQWGLAKGPNRAPEDAVAGYENPDSD